uniref:G_PROTEIN_RECEP_F3_4 domain-containing protein n=1 Tax=Macrostomum lignano TaxID=282301 RepID=A0A1I8H480_9PLAT
TRTVHVEALNDSKTIGICVYNTTVMGLIGVVLDFALPVGSIDLRHQLLSCCIIVCATTTVLLVFAPKIAILVRSRSPRVSAAGGALPLSNRSGSRDVGGGGGVQGVDDGGGSGGDNATAPTNGVSNVNNAD